MHSANNAILQEDENLGSLRSWLKKKSTKRGLIIGGSIAAIAALGYYAKTKSQAGTILGAKALTQQQQGIMILAKAQQNLKTSKSSGTSYWSRAVSFFTKSGVAKSAAEAMTKEIVQGKRPMPQLLANDLAVSGGGISGTTMAVGGAAVIGAAVLMNKD